MENPNDNQSNEKPPIKNQDFKGFWASIEQIY